MVRVVALLIVAVVAVALAQLVTPLGSAAVQRAPRIRPPRTARPGGHDWDRRRDQLYRQVKRIGGPEEHREQILAFLDSHQGVEAYVEPKTVMHPLSVLFVDSEGEAKRFELSEDAFLRELATTRGLPVFDATRVGYPERMRRRRSGE